MRCRVCYLLATALTVIAAGTVRGQEQQGPWPADVPGYVKPEPGEHPRLLFRKADLPELQKRTETPEGKVIIKRLRFLLDGANGDNPVATTGPRDIPKLIPNDSEYPGYFSGYPGSDGPILPCLGICHSPIIARQLQFG